MQPAIETGLFALSGAAIGGVIAAWVTYLLNERTRRLDLYKMLYPKKIEMVQEMLNEAYSLMINSAALSLSLARLPNLPSDAQERAKAGIDELREPTISKHTVFGSQILSDGWLLLEHDALIAAFNFAATARSAITTPNEGALPILLPAFSELVFALRKELHLPIINDLFRENPRWIDDAKIMVEAVAKTSQPEITKDTEL